MLRCLLAYVLLLSFQNAWGQRARFSQINIKDGLSQSTVRAIVQDSKGFIWLGTEDGLNRYDGIGMTVYNSDEDQIEARKLEDRVINSLYSHSSTETVWVGTDRGGVSVWSYDQHSFVTIDTSQGLRSNHVNKLISFSDDHVLVATDLGVDKISLKDFHVTPFTSLSDSIDVQDAVLDGEYVYLATHGDGLIELPLSGEGKKGDCYLPLNDQGDLLKKNSDKVRSLHLHNDGTLWVGFDGSGLARFNRKTKAFKFISSKGELGFSPRKVLDMIQDSEGVLWLGTDKGLARYNAVNRFFTYYPADEDDPFSIADNNVNCIFEDEANSLWLGTQLGASIFHRSVGKFNHVTKGKGSLGGIAYKKVYAFAEDGHKNIWIGTDGGGLDQMNFLTYKITNYNKEVNRVHNTILAIEYTNDGRVWFGSYGGGLGAYIVEADSFIPAIKEGLPSSTILSLEGDEKNNLWIGTFKGLCFLDREHDTLIVYKPKHKFEGSRGGEVGLEGKRIQSIEKLNEHLYVGTEKGMLVLNLSNMKTEWINEQKGLSNNEIYGITAVSEERVWIGTKNGLNLYNPSNNSVRVYSTKDGLISNFIYGICVDDQDDLWLSTNNGITRFNPDKEEDGHYYVRHYNAKGGLQADEFNQGAYFKSSIGEMFFGGLNGFNQFNPERIVDNAHHAKVVLKSFKIFDKEVDLKDYMEDEVLRLNYRDNFLEFEFAALDFVLPEKNRYQFKMEGLDEEWSSPSYRNYVSYKDLKGGDYVLRVRVSNNDGIWSEHEFRLNIYIQPPFWETSWFYALCVLLTALSIFLFVRLRMRKIKREKKILEEKVEERTRELASKTQELAEKNKDITDSIEYAKKIQKAILPDHQYLHSTLPDMFVLYLPKDIVSGDFYWFGEKNGLKIITAVDCTGHGVPGAFMSMIGSNLLNQIVLEKGITDAGEILENLNLGVQNALKQGTSAQETNDGMDISLCVIDDANLQLQWAGAYNPLYLVRNGELQKFKANKYPIGGAHMALEREYTTHKINLAKGDSVYMFSDGFVDQFGGEKGKKFMGKRFQRLLLENTSKTMEEQREVLYSTLQNWMSSYEQVDDICVIGVRV